MSKLNIVKEVVIYRIKPNQTETFVNQGLDELRNCAASFEGMIKHDTLVSAKDESVFIDLVEWDSLESAEKAAVQLDAKTKAGELPLDGSDFRARRIFRSF